MEDEASRDATRRERTLGLLMSGFVLLFLAFMSLLIPYTVSMAPLNYGGPDFLTPVALATVGSILVAAGILVRRHRAPHGP